jgi:hypothetical protein
VDAAGRQGDRFARGRLREADDTKIEAEIGEIVARIGIGDVGREFVSGLVDFDGDGIGTLAPQRAVEGYTDEERLGADKIISRIDRAECFLPVRGRRRCQRKIDPRSFDAVEITMTAPSSAMSLKAAEVSVFTLVALNVVRESAGPGSAFAAV